MGGLGVCNLNDIINILILSVRGPSLDVRI